MSVLALPLLLYAMFLYWCTACLVASLAGLLFWGAVALLDRRRPRRTVRVWGMSGISYAERNPGARLYLNARSDLGGPWVKLRVQDARDLVFNAPNRVEYVARLRRIVAVHIVR